MLTATTGMQGYSHPMGSMGLESRQMSSASPCSSSHLVDSEGPGSGSSLLPLSPRHEDAKEHPERETKKGPTMLELDQ